MTPTRNVQEQVECLLCCSRLRLDASGIQRLQRSLDRDLDWNDVVGLARAHRVTSLVYRHVNEVDPDSVPPATLERVKDFVRASELHNRILADALLAVLRRFEVAEVRVIPYKGPALTAAVYGEPALRQFGDLDLLVHPSDFTRSADLLQAAGYRATSRQGWEASFVDARGLVCIDLHRGIAPGQFPVPFDFDGAWSRSTAVQVAGRSVRTLGSEDTLIVLCVELVRDAAAGKTRLLKICDIAELLRVQPSLDWEQVLREARRLRSLRMLAFGVLLASRLLDLDLPDRARQGLPVDRGLDATVAAVRAQVLSGVVDSPVTWPDRLRFHAALREHARDRLYAYYDRYVRRTATLLVPNDRDRRASSVPFLVRPVRLLREYGLRRLGRELKRFHAP